MQDRLNLSINNRRRALYDESGSCMLEMRVAADKGSMRLYAMKQRLSWMLKCYEINHGQVEGITTKAFADEAKSWKRLQRKWDQNPAP